MEFFCNIACDGIGGTVKQLTAAESLTRPYNNQIPTAKEMLGFCFEKIPNIFFNFIAEEEMKNLRAADEKRYEYVINVVPGTRSYHQFIPLDRNRVGAKRCINVHNFDVFYIQDEDITIVRTYVV